MKSFFHYLPRNLMGIKKRKEGRAIWERGGDWAGVAGWLDG